ncbi:MAG: type-F conjugative transfer system secretin TraK [Alphaproteobacteria bacterium]|nr:type-F conjugative transfer system secretin TraK [Alphaproteobacteria bacterium]
MRKFIYLFLFLASSSLYAAQVYNLSEGSRIQANICPTEMNRIAIEGDRIAQVFGSDGKFTYQVDEETGQFFLKPLFNQEGSNQEGSIQEGGFPHVPVSLTLITESGLTQDLTLFPKEKTSATILLKPSVINSKTASSLSSFEGLSRALPYQDGLIQALRVLVSEGEGITEKQDNLETPHLRSAASGLTAQFVRQVKGPGYLAQVFEIKNTNAEEETLQEKQFFQTNDLALALSKTTLRPQEKATLYVLRRE